MWFSSTDKCTAGLKIVADEDFGDDRRIEVVFRVASYLEHENFILGAPVYVQKVKTD